MTELTSFHSNLSLATLQVEKAHGWWSRLRGLLGRRTLPMTQALWLKPCASIHTMFMQFPIDVVFLDKLNCVIGFRASIRPFHFAIAPKGCSSVLEMAAGGIEVYGLKKGDALFLG